MKLHFRNSPFPLLVGIVFLLLIVLIEMVSVSHLNGGKFTYSLDDPYIHLALSENLARGTYGVNLQEVSAPSSSILWPLILAPFSQVELFPFFLNLAAALFTVFFFVRILQSAIKIKTALLQDVFLSGLTILFILGTNLVGLVFTGMEHSVQVLMATLVAYGLITESENNWLPSWFAAVVVLAPLIRYENLAISAAAVAYLLLRKYYKQAALAIVLMGVTLGGFSLYLIHLGLDPFPMSVMVKSSVVESGGKVHAILGNLRYNLYYKQGLILSLGLLGLLSCFFFAENKKKRLLALIALAAVGMHLLVGRYGSYNRYEIYIWTFFWLVAVYLMNGALMRIMNGRNGWLNLMKSALVLFVLVLISCTSYLTDLSTLPVACNNIYEQHYQMHRFVTDYYQKPVAVNDLGYVSYKNDGYVLDLWGLASKEAFEYRVRQSNPDWLERVTQAKGTELVMIFEEWYDHIPQDWIKIGELVLSRQKVTTAEAHVAFFATNSGAAREIEVRLKDFVKTLPPGVDFVFQPKLDVDPGV